MSINLNGEGKCVANIYTNDDDYIKQVFLSDEDEIKGLIKYA